MFDADGNGGTVVGQYLKEVGKSGFLWTNTFTQAEWTFSKNAGQDNFWLGHSDGNDYDIKADYDEMRIWSSALTPEEIEKSGVAAPDTTFGETEIEIKSDATLDLGGNTLTVSSLSGYGKVQNGKLVVTKSICVKAGSVLTVGSGATIDITNANIVFSDSANIPTEGFTIAASSDGGRIVSSEPRRISGGYWLKLTDEKASIMRKGLIITFK